MPRLVEQDENKVNENVEPQEQDVFEPTETQVQQAQEEAQQKEEYDSTKMDPNEHVWDDGPTWAQINEWKDQFGEVYVTSVTPKTHIVWRTLTRFEYRRSMKALEQATASEQVTPAEASLNNEESIAELCILFPKYNRTNASTDLAGIASLISQQVMEASGFNSLDVRQL